MMHRRQEDVVETATKEELIQGILNVVERTYTTAGPTGPSGSLAEFFRALDDRTLREVAYQHGIFEGGADLEPEPDEDRDAR